MSCDINILSVEHPLLATRSVANSKLELTRTSSVSTHTHEIGPTETIYEPRRRHITKDYWVHTWLCSKLCTHMRNFAHILCVWSYHIHVVVCAHVGVRILHAHVHVHVCWHIYSVYMLLTCHPMWHVVGVCVWGGSEALHLSHGLCMYVCTYYVHGWHVCTYMPTMYPHMASFRCPRYPETRKKWKSRLGRVRFRFSRKRTFRWFFHVSGWPIPRNS